MHKTFPDNYFDMGDGRAAWYHMGRKWASTEDFSLYSHLTVKWFDTKMIYFSKSGQKGSASQTHKDDLSIMIRCGPKQNSGDLIRRPDGAE